MSEKQQYNDISPELREEVKKALPKPGQTIWFESVRPKSRGTTVLPIDRIYDPWKEKLSTPDGGTEYRGGYVDIAYVTGMEPAKGPNGLPREIIGRIQFTRLEYGRIGIRGDNRADENLFTFMYLTNQNQSNRGKKWFIDSGKNPSFKQDEPKKKAADTLDFDRKVVVALTAIDRMADDKLREFASGLDIDWVTPFTESDEIRVELGNIAKKNPMKIINLDKDVNILMKVEIKSAEKHGIIRRDDVLQMWVWPDSGERICAYIPAKDPIEALIGYFNSKGGDTYKFVRSALERVKEAKSQAKNIKKTESSDDPNSN